MTTSRTRTRYLLLYLILLLALVVPVSATELIVTLTEDTADEIVGNTSALNFINLRNGAGSYTLDGGGTVSDVYLASSVATLDIYSPSRRFGYGFNTSDIPDSATIDSVKLSIWITEKFDNLTMGGLGITEFHPSTANDFVAGDYSQIGASTRYATDIPYGSITTGQYTNFTFNAAGIANLSKTGYTNFIARFTKDIDNENITYNANTSSYYKISDYTQNVSRQPFLTIDYTTDDTTPPASITGLGNSTDCQNVTWSWTNPDDADFSYDSIYKDGSFLKNATETSEVWETFANVTSTISIRTVDTNGNENTTWVNMTAHTPLCSVKTWPKLMIMFDDASADIYDNAYPVMSAHNFNATVYTITGRVDAYSSTLTSDNLTTMYNAGWDIANHGDNITHTRIDTMTPAVQILDLTNATNKLLGWGFTRSAYHFAYPGGDYDDTTINSTRSVGLLTARTVKQKVSILSPFSNTLTLNITDLAHRTEAPSHLTNQITGTTNETIIILFHKIGDETTDEYFYPTANFTAFELWVSDNGYVPITISEWYALNGVDTYTTPVASFTANVTSGQVPLAVGFTDTSTNTPTIWNWSFGDGNFSEDQNPTFTYTFAGQFTVNLTSTNAAGSNTTSKIKYIRPKIGSTKNPGIWFYYIFRRLGSFFLLGESLPM